MLQTFDEGNQFLVFFFLFTVEFCHFFELLFIMLKWLVFVRTLAVLWFLYLFNYAVLDNVGNIKRLLIALSVAGDWTIFFFRIFLAAWGHKYLQLLDGWPIFYEFFLFVALDLLDRVVFEVEDGLLEGELPELWMALVVGRRRILSAEEELLEFFLYLSSFPRLSFLIGGFAAGIHWIS